MLTKQFIKEAVENRQTIEVIKRVRHDGEPIYLTGPEAGLKLVKDVVELIAGKVQISGPAPEDLLKQIEELKTQLESKNAVIDRLVEDNSQLDIQVGEAENLSFAMKLLRQQIESLNAQAAALVERFG